MPAATGILLPFDFVGQQTLDLSAVVRTSFVNDFPLISRLQRVKGTAEQFTIIGYAPRGRNFMATAALSASATAVSIGPATTGYTVQIGDPATLMIGDVLRITTSGSPNVVEDLEITSTPNAPDPFGNYAVTGTVNVARGAGGTTPAAHNGNDPIILVGNSRRGNEVDQRGYRAGRSFTVQNHQTWQFPIQIGGLTLDVTNLVEPENRGVLAFEQENKLIEMMRDMEYSSYYGNGEPETSDLNRPKQKGLRNLIDPGNVVYAPTNPTAYTPLSFLNDVFQRCFDNGGNPDTCFCSTGFMTGLFAWGFNRTRIDNPAQTALGVNIEEYNIPLYGRSVKFIPSLQLGSPTNITACVIDSQQVQWSWLRQEMYQQRGNRGDAVEGDFIARGAVRLANPLHHAWVEGIQAFAPSPT